MRLSCIPVSYFKEIISGNRTVFDWAQEAEELRLDYFDLSILFFKRSGRSSFEEMKKQFDSMNIKVGIINTYTDFTNPDKEIRKNELKKLKRYIEYAGLIDAKYIRITAGPDHPQTSRENGIKWVVDCMGKADEYAKNTNLKLVFENHSKPGIWDYYDFSFSTRNFLEIYKNIKNSSIKILFDTANTVAYGDDPLYLLEEIAEDLACVHIADIESSGAFKPVVIGTGAVPFKQIFTKMGEIGFNNVLSIEEASLTGRSGLEKTIAYTMDTWLKYGTKQ